MLDVLTEIEIRLINVRYFYVFYDQSRTIHSTSTTNDDVIYITRF